MHARNINKNIKKNIINTDTIYSQLSMLEKEIDAFKEANIDKDISDSLETLYRVLRYEILKDVVISEQFNLTKTLYSDLIGHFVKLLPNLSKPSHELIRVVSDSIDELDKKINKIPLSVKIKSAISGVVGAVVGFAIGATVGALLTSWAVGLGTIPCAILGTVFGFGIGAKVKFNYTNQNHKKIIQSHSNLFKMTADTMYKIAKFAHKNVPYKKAVLYLEDDTKVTAHSQINGNSSPIDNTNKHLVHPLLRNIGNIHDRQELLNRLREIEKQPDYKDWVSFKRFPRVKALFEMPVIGKTKAESLTLEEVIQRIKIKDKIKGSYPALTRYRFST